MRDLSKGYSTLVNEVLIKSVGCDHKTLVLVSSYVIILVFT